MKEYPDTVDFGRNLQLALEAMRDEIETLPWFKARPFRTHSGTDFMLFWNHRNPDNTIVANTGRNWVTGKCFPDNKNWKLLTITVRRSEASLRGWDAGIPHRPPFEAAQNLLTYSDSDKPRRRRALIDEIYRRLQELSSLG
jgi:hypothetical protein